MEDLMEEWDILDFILTKGKYTWPNRRCGATNIVASLDQFLIHSSWVLSSWDASSSIMPQGESND